MAFPHSGPSRNPLELGARGIVRETHLAAHPSWWLVFDIHLIAFGANRGLSTLLNSCGQVVAEATGVPRRGYPHSRDSGGRRTRSRSHTLGYVLIYQLLENSWLSPKFERQDHEPQRRTCLCIRAGRRKPGRTRRSLARVAHSCPDLLIHHQITPRLTRWSTRLGGKVRKDGLRRRSRLRKITHISGRCREIRRDTRLRLRLR